MKLVVVVASLLVLLALGCLIGICRMVIKKIKGLKKAV